MTSRDLGENLCKDVSILYKGTLNNVQTFTSSPRRVTQTYSRSPLHNNVPRYVSYINPGSLLPLPQSPPSRSPISSEAGSVIDKLAVSCYKRIIRHDLLDDSNAAEDLTDGVKKRVNILLRNGESARRPESTWPENMTAKLAQVVQEVIQLMDPFRTTMRDNFEPLDVYKI